MSEIQEIEVFLSPDGTVRVEVRGAKGPGCLALTEGLERALGGQLLGRELTPEHDEAGEALPDTVSTGAGT